MKHIINILIILILFILTACSTGSVAGSGSSVGNAKVAIVAGTVTDNGNAVPNQKVLLIPEDYINSENIDDSVIIETVTDSVGNFRTMVGTENRFTIQISTDTKGFIAQNRFLADSTNTIKCPLLPFGEIELIIDTSLDTTGFFCTIPGTKIFSSPKFTSLTDSTLSAKIKNVIISKYSGLFVETGDKKLSRATDNFDVKPDSTTVLKPFYHSITYDDGNSPIIGEGVYALMTDKLNRVFMGTSSGQISINDNGFWYGTNLNNFGITTVACCLTYTDIDDFWCGTSFGGTLHFKGGYATIYTTENSNISSDGVINIAIKSDRSIWAATIDNGVSVRENGKWSVISTKNSNLPSDSIRDIAIDSNQTVWVVTTKGVSQYFNGRWINYNRINSNLETNYCERIIVDRHNTKWISSRDGNLFSYKSGKWEKFSKNDYNAESNCKWISCIYSEKESDKIWVGTKVGTVHCYNNGYWTTYNSENSSLKPNCGVIISMAEDNYGDIWVGTANSGVVRFYEKNDHYIR